MSESLLEYYRDEIQNRETSEERFREIMDLIRETGEEVEVVLSAIAVVVNEEGEHLLLRRRPDDRSYPNKIVFPGGKVDPGETVEEAACRELNEETGLKKKIVKKYGVRRAVQLTRQRVYEIHVFVMEDYVEGDVITLSDEHVEALWLSIAGHVTHELVAV